MRRLTPLLLSSSAFQRSSDMIRSVLGGLMLPVQAQLTARTDILNIKTGGRAAQFASGKVTLGSDNAFKDIGDRRHIRAESATGRGFARSGRGRGHQGGRFESSKSNAGRFGGIHRSGAQKSPPTRQIAGRGTRFDGVTNDSEYEGPRSRAGGGGWDRGSNASFDRNSGGRGRGAGRYSGGRSEGRGRGGGQTSYQPSYERGGKATQPAWESTGFQSGKKPDSRGQSWVDRRNGGGRSFGRGFVQPVDGRGRGRGSGRGRSEHLGERERQYKPTPRAESEVSWDDSRSDGGWRAQPDRRAASAGDGFSQSGTGRGRTQREEWQPDRILNGADHRGALGATKDAWQGDALYGIAPVLAALQAGRRELHALYVQEGHLEGSSGRVKSEMEAAVKAARVAGIDVLPLPKHDLNMLSDNRPHQGLVLDASELEWEEMDRLEGASQIAAAGAALPVWLALDEVQDPMNLGAALRCAHFLGVAGVLACSRNTAPLSPATSKASAGAMEVMAVHSTKNLPRTLAAAEADGWLVIGATADAHASDVCAITLDRPTILVVGGEGAGLRTNVRKACSQLVCINGSPSVSSLPDGTASGPMERWSVDSLNLGVATGIMLHRLLASRSTAPVMWESDLPAVSASNADAPIAHPAALGDGLAAIALADEVHSANNGPAAPGLSGDSPSLESHKP